MLRKPSINLKRKTLFIRHRIWNFRDHMIWINLRTGGLFQRDVNGKNLWDRTERMRPRILQVFVNYQHKQKTNDHCECESDRILWSIQHKNRASICKSLTFSNSALATSWRTPLVSLMTAESAVGAAESKKMLLKKCRCVRKEVAV